MNKPAPCGVCGGPVEVPPEQIQDMLRQLVEQRGRKLVDAETAMRRNALCEDCDAYGPGGTCMYSGGLIPVKTRLAGEQCPEPSGPRW